MTKKVKQKLFMFIKLAVSISIIAYIFTKQVDFKQMVECLKTADVFYLLVAGVMFILCLACGLFRWDYLLFAQGIIVKFSRLVRIYCVGLFFNLFMVGLTGGDVVKIYYIAKESKKNIEGGTTVVIDRLFGMGALIVVVFTAVLFTFKDEKFAVLFWPVVSAFFIMFLVMLCFLNMNKFKSIKFIRNLIERLPARDKISRVYQAFNAYKNKKKLILKIVILSLLIHPLYALANVAIAKAIGIEGVPVIYYFVLIPVISFISALPISVSGWGVGEALYVTLFGMFGVSPILAVSLSITFKLYYILCGILSSFAYMVPGLEHPKHFEDIGKEEK